MKKHRFWSRRISGSLAPHSLLALSLLSASASAQQVMWRDNPLNGKVVGLTFAATSWTAARAQAVTGTGYGGNLVTVRSVAENQWLVTTFSSSWLANGQGPWLGLNDVAQEGNFVWSSGEPVSFLAWASGQPDNAGNAEDCAHYLGTAAGTWNDRSDGTALRALIEVTQRPFQSWSWPTSYIAGTRPLYGCTFDMDGDGDSDIASPDRDSNRVTLFRNDGTGGFTQANLIAGCGAVHTTVPVDWDLDGDSDLLATDNNTAGRLLLLRNDGANWTVTSLASVTSVHGVAVGDVNGDGRRDIVTSSTGNDDRVRVFLRQADGSLATPATYGPYPNFDEAYQPTLTDLDADGALDLIVAGGGVRLLRGSTSGTFTDLGNLGSGRSLRCTAVDIDFNGRQDILTSRFDADTFEVWTAVSSGALALNNYTRTQNLASGDGPHWVETGDVDGDGDPDVVIPAALTNTIHIWRNSLGTLTADHVLAGQNYPTCVSVTDLNRDAKSDIVSWNHQGNAVLVDFNQSRYDCNGNGIDDPADIASGFSRDCNGNGRPDSCDISRGFSTDGDGDGLPDECEPVLLSVTPSVLPASLGGTVTVVTRNSANGSATLQLTSPQLPAPLSLPVSLSNNTGNVVIPALGAAFAADVIANATISTLDPYGQPSTTAPLSSAVTWRVPRIVAATPSNAPFDVNTAVVFTLADHVATSGIGSATFGDSPAQAAYLFSSGGQTWVSTIAPAQASPGPVNVLLRFGNEFTLAQRGFVYLAPGITSLSVTEGWQAGGEPLTIGLFGFEPAVPVAVRFGTGSQFASVLAVPSGVSAASSVSLTTPFQFSGGTLDLEVVQYAGQPNEKRAISPGAWLSKIPVVQSITPSSAFQGGGESVSIVLRGLTPQQSTRIEIGSQAYTVVNVGTLSQSSASFTTVFSVGAGAFNVVARQAIGSPQELSATLANGFTVVAPSIQSLAPPSGPREGGTVVIVQTDGFRDGVAATATLGGVTVPATVVGFGASQTVTFRTVLATASGVTSVTIDQGALSATLPGSFTFDPARVTNYCQAKVTSAGTLPVIGFSGSPSLSTGDFALTLSNALPDKYCLYFAGTAQTNTPFYGGKLCVATNIFRGPTISTDLASFASCPFTVTPAMVGQNRYFQWWFRDPADSFSVGLSGGLRVIGFYP